MVKHALGVAECMMHNIVNTPDALYRPENQKFEPVQYLFYKTSLQTISSRNIAYYYYHYFLQLMGSIRIDPLRHQDYAIGRS